MCSTCVGGRFSKDIRSFRKVYTPMVRFAHGELFCSADEILVCADELNPGSIRSFRKFYTPMVRFFHRGSTLKGRGRGHNLIFRVFIRLRIPRSQQHVPGGGHGVPKCKPECVRFISPRHGNHCF